MEPRTIIFFGMSGSGKGTEAELVVKYLTENDPDRKVLHLETGVDFREFMEGPGHTSKLIKRGIANGALPPAFLPIHFWTRFLIDNFSGQEHLVLDGMSRREVEAIVLDEAIRFYEIDGLDVVVINTSREVATERLRKRGREEDKSEERIQKRLDWYEENTTPAIEVLRKAGNRIHTINGNQTIEEVDKETKSALGLI